MAATPGYKGKLSITGTTTATTGEACTHGSGNLYQITNAAKRVLDPSVARVWKDTGSPISAGSIVSEDLLFGTVTLTAPAGGAVTLDASYLPRIVVATVKDVKLSVKLDTKDITPINGTGDHVLMATTRDATMTAGLYDDLRTDLDSGSGGEQSFATLLSARTPKLFELDMTGAGTWVFRGWMMSDGIGDSSSASDVVMGDITWKLADRSPSATANAGYEFGAP